MAMILLRTCAIVYWVAVGLGLLQLFSPRPRDERVAAGALAMGALIHLMAIGARTAELGSFPMASTHDALSLFGFTLAGFALFIAVASKVPQVGPLGGGLVALVVTLAVLAEPANEVPVRLQSPWLPVHIALAFLGNAAFVVAGTIAMVYLAQEKRLRDKRSPRRNQGTGLNRLPALEVLDRTSLRLIEVGFPLMTLALISGMLYGREVWGYYWRWELRNIVSVLVWALFAVLLHFRITIGWRGRKAASLTVVGVAATLVSIVGLRMLGFYHYQ